MMASKAGRDVEGDRVGEKAGQVRRQGKRERQQTRKRSVVHMNMAKILRKV